MLFFNVELVHSFNDSDEVSRSQRKFMTHVKLTFEISMAMRNKAQHTLRIVRRK